MTTLERGLVPSHNGPLPLQAHSMACQVAQWDREIVDTPYTSVPAPSQILSPEIVRLYENFSENGQETFTRQLGFNILKGEFTFKRGRFPLNEHVSSFSSTPTEFLERLRIWSDRWVAEWACNAERLGCDAISSLEQSQRP